MSELAPTLNTRSRRLLHGAAGFYDSNALLWILLSIAILLRLAQYLFNRSLWGDESFVALYVTEVSLSDVLHPVGVGETLPLGYRVLTKIAVLILGSGEYALRLVPLICGVLSVFLFCAVAKRSLARQALPLALCFFALSDPLIYFASEVKQYSTDVVIVLALYWLTRLIEAKPLTVTRVALLAFVGAMAIWFSYASVFVLAGLGLCLAFSYLRKWNWRRVVYVSVVGLAWGSSFAMYYFLLLRRVGTSEYLLAYWQGAFMPFPPRSFEDMKWFAFVLLRVFGDPVGFYFSGLAAFAFVLGCVSMFARDKRKLFAFTSPILFALLASGLRKYPFQGRLLLFTVPCFLLLVAEGVEYCRARLRGGSRVMVPLLVAMLLFHPLIEAVYHIGRPRTREEIKPVLEHIKRHRRDEDLLYVYYAAKPAFDYYSSRYGLDDSRFVAGVRARTEWRKYVEDLGKLRGNERVWILFSHVFTSEGADEEQLFLSYLDEMGDRLDSFKSPGAAVYLYDLANH